MFLTESLGFYNLSIGDHLQTYQQMCEQAERVKTKQVEYLKWSLDERLEMWTRVTDGVPDVRVNYFYAGESRMKVALIEKTPRRETYFSDGAFLCRTRGVAGPGWVAGQLPFVFDTPAYHRYDKLTLPRVAVVQLTAFASDLTGYADEDEFDEAFPPDEEGYCWDYMHFVPICLTTPRGAGGELQTAGAPVAGYVRDTALITNPLTGLDYCWAKIETVGGEMDVVCAPDNLSGYLAPGGLAAGHFYISGRLIEDTSH